MALGSPDGGAALGVLVISVGVGTGGLVRIGSADGELLGAGADGITTGAPLAAGLGETGVETAAEAGGRNGRDE